MSKYSLDKVFIYSDGSAKPNPGRGGYGTIVKFVNDDYTVDHIEEFAEGFKTTTNNRMELMGIIKGLSAVSRPSDIHIMTDSAYVVNGFTKGWIDAWKRNGWKTSEGKDVKNDELWKRILELKLPHNVTFIWIKGHYGHLENERCDYLANKAADGYNLVKDKNGILRVVYDEEPPE